MNGSTLDLGILPLGTTQLLALPGQDVAELGWRHDTLLRECRPRNLIERQWIYDLAVLMGRIAYVRQARQALHFANHHKLAGEIIEPAPNSKEGIRRELRHIEMVPDPEYTDEDIAIMQGLVDRGFKPKAKAEARELEVRAELIVSDLQKNLATYERLEAYEQSLVRERDRVIAQFDRRRRDELSGAVIVIESKELVDGGAAGITIEPTQLL